jgi:hypothetical protein
LIGLLARLGMRLAWSADRTQRWRQVCLVVCAFVVTVLALLTVSLIIFADDASDRRHARLPVLAMDGEPYGLTLSLRGEIWESRQFPVLWIDEGQRGQPQLLPPGLRTLPDPGTAVLSPGLVAAGAGEGLGFTASDAGTGPQGTIGAEGLATASEFLAYARPPAGRSLGAGGALMHVAGFSPDPGQPALGFETEEQSPSVGTVAFLSAWLFLLPAAIVVAGCAAALSPLRASRFTRMYRLGLSARAVRGLAAIETASLAGAGILAAVTAWWFASAHVEALPLSGLTLHPGELVLPAVAVAATGVLCLVVFAVAGALTVRTQGRIRVTWSAAGTPEALSGWRAAPMVAAVLLLVASRVLGRDVALGLILTALLLLLAGLPWTLPWLVHRLGRRLSASPRPARWLAGRRLTFSPSALGRPAVAVGALIFVVGALTGIYQRISHTSEFTGPPEESYVLDWRDARTGDVDQVRELLGRATVLPIDDSTETDPRALLSGCAEAAPFVAKDPVQVCSGDGALDASAAADFLTATGVRPVLGGTPHPLRAGDAATVLVAGGPGLTDAAVWRALNGELAAVNLSRLGQDELAPPLYRDWLVAAGAIGLVLLMGGVLQSYGNRVLALVDEDRRLVRVALDGDAVRRVQRWTLAGPLVVAAPAGFTAAVAFVWAANEVEIAAPATALLAAEAVLVVVASAAVALGVSAVQRSWLR